MKAFYPERTLLASCYREMPPRAGLAGDLVCSWVGVVGPEGPPAEDRVLPDGCVDFVWDGTRLFIAGPDEEAVKLDRLPGSAMVGVRLRPGRAPGLLGVAAVEIKGSRVELSELWGSVAGELAEHLSAAPEVESARQILEDAVVARLRSAPPTDGVVDAMVRTLDASPAFKVTRLARELSVSRRHLQRRALVGLGYGPKTFAGIVRFQRFAALANVQRDRGLAWLARASGYADQAHLTRECGRFAGLTPRQFVSWRRSVPFVQDGDLLQA